MALILVTGVNGFVGSNVVLQLIKAGYKVRGTVRGSKMDNFRKIVGDKFPALEVVQVDDVGSGDLTDAMKGVDAVIHVAAPLPFGGPGPKENLNIAVEGYLNVLRQAVKNDINKVVMTGSWASTIDPTLKQAFEGHISTEKDWGNVTEEEFLSGNHDPMWTYLAAKILAERAAWKFAANEPALDLSIIIPPFIFGPFVPGFPLPEQIALSSNQHIYTLLKGAVPPPLPPLFCDVRDVAQAHVAALSTPKSSSNVEDKRFLVSGGFLIWKDAVEYLHATRPGLKARLPALDAVFAPFPGTPTSIDASRAREVLGMDKYYTWKEAVDGAIDGLLEAEKTWAATSA
ncbi:putative 3-beta hydroxysteroid dehydrogenase/isomerase family protein [Lyophyllum shimeji]|uniref:3-beta hydroxysteroid dehydrogenase/isomerase family protein n=1 Tax=Lyophyllum shimeji TaxID=47721 RepID=A0A9P3Q1D3_LYOSH|nr:putative 3-beta hydroxysteroid dehydrogenase/isomerase family protein [Lyophyllum shimeji]